MSDGRQRQRHGVTKNLVEGIGGLLFGAAAVLLLREWLSRRGAIPAPVPVSAAPGADTATIPTDPSVGASTRPRRQSESQPKSMP